jgi:pyruvate dehydrogenase E2 component (dihydrolipoamide acetyltransferase)
MALKEIQLPELGEGVTEGEMIKWLVKIGDKVSADQAIAEIMTDKASVEVPTPVAGTIKEFKLKEGDVAKVGMAMLILDLEGAGATAAKTAAPPAAHAAPAAPAQAAAPIVQQTQPSANVPHAQAPAMTAKSNGGGLDVHPPAAQSNVLATPATRRLAREMEIDINTLHGSGVAGRITRDDVMNTKGTGATAAGAPSVSPQIPKMAYASNQAQLEERVPLRGIRKKIAENLQMAKHIIPHFTLMDEANVTALFKMREDLKPLAEKQNVKITYLPFVIKAMIATIREFPQFNASIDDASSEIVYKKYFNIGFAADTPNGLLVPVIKSADQKSMLNLSREIVELAKKAREGKLALDEMKGATITITNIGSVGGTYATPIINHPEVAILGMYKISDKPVVKDGKLDVIKVMNFTITADHRLIDGAVAANFLKAFINRIENPGALMLEMM